MLKKILKYISATIITVCLLPMWIIWLLLDIALGNDNLRDMMESIWS